jgi:hypothetical protein
LFSWADQAVVVEENFFLRILLKIKISFDVWYIKFVSHVKETIPGLIYRLTINIYFFAIINQFGACGNAVIKELP